MKCDKCWYANECEGGFLCGHPDEDIAEVNNDAMACGKAITSCSEYKTKQQARDKHCEEEAMLNKAEEIMKEIKNEHSNLNSNIRKVVI